MRSSLPLGLGLLLVALSAAPASASHYEIEGTVLYLHDGEPFVQQSYADAQLIQAAGGITVPASGVPITMRALSAASIAGLQASAFAEIREAHPTQVLGADITRNGRSFARAIYTDVVIEGPPGPVTTSLRMHLGGQVLLASGQTATGLNASSAGVAVSFLVNDVLVSDVPASFTSGSLLFTAEDGGPIETPVELGVLSSWAAPEGIVTSPEFSVGAGTPFTLEIVLAVSAQATADALENAFVAHANADFGHTLRFVTDRPVFDLPAGYTVSSPDAGIADNQAACVGACPSPASACDAGKLGCIAANQACLLKAHAAAEKAGEPVDVGALMGCSNALLSCITRLEGKQSDAKPASLCTVTGDLGDLEGATYAFSIDAVTAIDPSYPTVGAPSTCDAGKKSCVARRTSCLLKVLGAAVRKGELAAAAKLQKCGAAFEGCLGKLETKQKPQKPSSLCAVTGDLEALEGLVDAFVADSVGRVQDLD
jgi:hypothetical protein